MNSDKLPQTAVVLTVLFALGANKAVDALPLNGAPLANFREAPMRCLCPPVLFF